MYVVAGAVVVKASARVVVTTAILVAVVVRPGLWLLE